MAKVEKEVIINAPLEKVFSYVSEPGNLLEFWPSLIEIEEQPMPFACRPFQLMSKGFFQAFYSFGFIIKTRDRRDYRGNRGNLKKITAFHWRTLWF